MLSSSSHKLGQAPLEQWHRITLEEKHRFGPLGKDVDKLAHMVGYPACPL
jgi:hypothetical protein